MIIWTNERRKLSDLVPWDRNPRQIRKEQAERLADSLDEFGQVQAIAIGPGNEILGGHQRKNVWTALDRYGPNHEVDVRVASRALTEKEREKLVVYLHKGTMGEWDWDSLADGFEIEDLLEWGFDEAELGLAGFDLGGDMPEDPGAQVDRAEELQEKWQVQRGQIWQIGRHRLMCGDSTVAGDVKRLMGGEKALLMTTDPPYGVDFQGAKYNPRAKAWNGIEGDQRQGAELTAWLSDCLKVWLPSIDKKSAFYIWAAPMQEGAAVGDAIRDVGLHIQSQIIWSKNAFALGQADYQWKHETCWYAFFKGENHRWYGGRKQTTVWNIDKIANQDYEHPHQKPCELYARSMRNHLLADEICVDPFLSSGTTLIACEQTGRIGYGMEIEPKYCAVALERLADMGLQPKLIS